jgi:hypothetical protein
MLKKYDIAPKPVVARVWSNVFICIGCFCRFGAVFQGPAGVLWQSVLFFCFRGVIAVQGYQTSGLVLSAGEDKGGGGGVLRPGFSGRVLIRPGARCLEEKGRPERLSVFDWYSLLFML